MFELDAHKMLGAPAAATAATGIADAPARTKRQLSPAALAAASVATRTAISPIVVAGFVRAIEAMLIALVGTLVYYVYVFPARVSAGPISSRSPASRCVSVIAFQAVDVYQVHAFRRPLNQMARMIPAWSVVFLLAIAVSFFFKLDLALSRVWLFSFWAVGLLILLAERTGLYMLVKQWMRDGRLTRRTVIVGGGAPGEALIEALKAQVDGDVRVVGVFDDRNDERSPTHCAGFAKLGTVDDFVEFARRTRIDLVIFSLPISAENRILAMLKKLWILPVDIRLSAHSNKLRFRPRSYSYIGTVPVLDVFDRPIADWDVVMKWLFDKIVGGLMLLAALPVMAVIAIAIKLDSRGPILFKQKRYGFNNDLIEVYKFRSMYVDQSDAAANKLVTRDDPRVTRVGRFIRKASLDELPQFFTPVVTAAPGSGDGLELAVECRLRPRPARGHEPREDRRGAVRSPAITCISETSLSGRVVSPGTPGSDPVTHTTGAAPAARRGSGPPAMKRSRRWTPRQPR